MEPLEELRHLLRPAGGGIHLVSSGRAEQQEWQRRLYRAGSDDEVERRFAAAFESIASARAFLLAIPSDVGAGIVRGANLGPQAIRTALWERDPDWLDRYDGTVVDLGDVFVIPQLLHDDMLTEAQKRASQRSIYPSLHADDAARMPVSPLSIAERALDLIFSLNPAVAPLVIGGDHSTAWPVVAALARARRDRWGIVQPDAHTDLLSERLGVKYCFATWSFHANELLQRDGRLVQVGTRASRYSRQHWEATTGVRQFWADECRARPAEVLDAIVEHLRARGVESVYISNDIDGTDSAFADATGAPEPDGLEPQFVVTLIRRLAEKIGVLGGDVMEVAPSLGNREKTVHLAAEYLVEVVNAVVR
jgi:agmatinase